MFGRRPFHAYTDQLFPHPPATMIHAITTYARQPRASRHYRQVMTMVDAALFSRPDLAELVHRAALIDRDVKEGRR